MSVVSKSELALGQADTDTLLRHYAVAGPLMERAFGATPFVWSTLPGGFSGPTIFHRPLSPHTKPKGPVVDVPTAAGVHRYPALSAERIEGLVRHGAVEFYSWPPCIADPTRVRFARLLLETASPEQWLELNDGLDAVEGVLFEAKIESLRVYDGGNGVALWIPFCNAPSYEDVRTWLHAQCAQAILRNPSALTLEPNSRGGPPVHLHVQTNAVGRFSVLPYSVRAKPGFPVAMPIDLDDIDDESGDFPFLNGNVLFDFEPWMQNYSGTLCASERSLLCAAVR